MANQLGGPAGPAPSTAPPTRHPDPRAAASATAGGRRAVVGAASALRGQLAAREDVWIDGQLEGEVKATAHQVTIGAGGRVKADVKARAVVIEGELVGNVVASEMVTLRAGGKVVGDVRSPRVVLEDGCQFQGTVDMESEPEGSTAGETPAPEPAPALIGEGSG